MRISTHNTLRVSATGFAVALLAATAQAATLHVSSLADSGAGSLRDLVSSAASGDTLVFDVAGTITLTSVIAIDFKDLSIENNQVGGLVQLASATGSDSLLRVGVGRTVTLKNLSLINARNAVQNNGNLTLVRVLARNNSGSMGAAVSGCVAPDSQVLNVVDSTFLGNTAQNGGGAIAACGQVNISGSTFSGNRAVYGGALSVTNTGAVNIVNSTFFGNTATGFGGAVQTDYDGLSITHVTFSGNTAPTAASLSVAGGKVVDVRNSIFAGPSANGHCVNAITGINQHNLRQLDASGNTCGVSLAGDPMLGALGDNGGPTPTMALGAGSAAIDAGAAGGAPSTDQRGVARPQGAGVDIGAYEFEPVLTHFEGQSATGSGLVKADLSGGGATCSLSAPALLAAAPGANPATPPGIVFPHGLFEFTARHCTAGATVTFTMTYPAPLPAGTRYYKWGPAPGNATPHWYELPATINGHTVIFSITDGGLGDDDLQANGTLVDQGGPGVPVSPGGGGVAAVPTVGEWSLLMLAGLLGGAAIWQRRRLARQT